MNERKSVQLQIRVSPSEKAAIRRAARRAGLDVSAYVLQRLFSPRADEFRRLVRDLHEPGQARYAFAAINDLLARLTYEEFSLVLEDLPAARLEPENENYLAAMVEHAAHQKRVPPPAWTKTIVPLELPVFATELKALRLPLLLSSPAAFRRRNIFIDSSVGDRV